MIGSSISHYKILSKLGEGGMGEVWLAEDTKLERKVALKFLASHLVSDPEIHKRFEREAKAAAGLSHSNICTVFEIDEADGKPFLAAEYIEGESLEAKIEQGPLKLDEALEFGRQIADGLQAAHAKGIVHRDIKPGNILVTPAGQVKILDFGLALLSEGSRLTKLDTTVGTVAYMSPEQAQGAEVDHRSDIWALGCVLYEMVAGVRPFKGQYDQALLYEIVNEQPEPLTGIRAGVPMELEFIVGKCLAKDRADRHQSATEIAVDLRTLAERLKSGRSTILRTTNLATSVPATMTAAHTSSPAEILPPDVVAMKRTSRRALQALAGMATLAFLGVTAVHFTESPADQTTRRFSFVPPADIDNTPLKAGLALSPNGMHIAYTTSGTSSKLSVQDLDQDEPRQLAGTEGASMPFWSPDSAFVAYEAGGELRKVSVQGGASELICALPANVFLEGTWSPDGESIVFSSGRGGAVLYKISTRDGSPEELITASEFPETFSSASRPRFVTGAAGPVLLFTLGGARSAEMYVRNLDTGQTTALGLGDRPVYSAATGHLIYQSERNVYELWARPFSPETLQFSGSGFPLRQNARQPSASDDGTLVYMDGSAGGSQTLVWRSRTGELLKAVGQPQPDISQPVLSPDGQQVAVRSQESGSIDIWVHDLSRSTKARLTFDEEQQLADNPGWWTLGREIVYRVTTAPNRIMRRSADGSGEAVALVEGPGTLSGSDSSRDGRFLVYCQHNLETGRDIRYIELGPDGDAGEPVTVLDSPADEYLPRLSPDGRFLAYSSDESGRVEIYVRPFPDGDGKWQASVNGGELPRWRSDGSELYYFGGSALMAVSVSSESAFALGRPQLLFEAPGLVSLGGTFGGYDVSADGQRFLTVAPVEGAEAASPKIRLVQNWHEETLVRE